MSNAALFMIEGGKALQMAKEYIAERIRVQAETQALAIELGVARVYNDRQTGVLTGVVFDGEIHPDFNKPKKRDTVSFPRKGTAWHERISALKGHASSGDIAAALNIPLSISYSTPEGGSGVTMIGSPLTECGFLFMGEEGPYAMWAPDVPAMVAERVAKGQIVNEPAKSFQFDIPGCRRIEEEEWKILVLQRQLAEKQTLAKAA